MYISLFSEFDGFQNKKFKENINGKWLLVHGTFWSYSVGGRVNFNLNWICFCSFNRFLSLDTDIIACPSEISWAAHLWRTLRKGNWPIPLPEACHSRRRLQGLNSLFTLFAHLLSSLILKRTWQPGPDKNGYFEVLACHLLNQLTPRLKCLPWPQLLASRIHLQHTPSCISMLVQ